ncbi:chitooligosaccharidolytic beta-N-acetylglucosaminidase isoform X2 [Diorhabda carinulata]|uniref:chitooligosaccharidolytic beta-N-acetylglucosaminidase isoform X2 n=2 Tax=Diorhabda carinulata TaxID=1163345 RepID=UPI0025A20291|nr:chitooligosaccharidolytic beta-N-acetylglucosaminidase isoform X2 [Diorhabda carinulata]
MEYLGYTLTLTKEMERLDLKKLIWILLLVYSSTALNSVWKWECEQNSCQKKRISNNDSAALSLPACRLFCADSAALWPKPTGDFTMGSLLTKININSIDVISNASETPIFDLVTGAVKEFRADIQASIKGTVKSGGKSVLVSLNIANTSLNRLTLETIESYSLFITETNYSTIDVRIIANNYFGARHGLQTLSQLIIFDDLRDELQIPTEVVITDKPAYPHRGLLLDTSRNYITVDAIKKTIKAMGASKLNTFHWHITDSQSFPYYSKSHPELSKLGAYSPSKIYSLTDVKDIVNYGKLRGVKVIPEFDAPAHVGEGWQDTEFVVCFNAQPWQSYCVEPPCGQFDPTQDKLYDLIEDIYGDMLEQFDPDIFHMGGDEVKFDCWKETPRIVEWMVNKGWNSTDPEKDYVKLWNYFQKNALERLYRKAGRKIPAIMWTSHLTQPEYLLESLPKENYIIQVWTLANDSQINNLLDNGYNIILSNYDGLYLDCGFAGWVQDGNNWCSPYIGWQKVYENKPERIAGHKVNQVLGAEAALWTEQADSASIDTKLWPRAAAMAEVLWSKPATGWEAAEERFLVHRDRLLDIGINTDTIEPEWCMQNEENCRIGSSFNIPSNDL